MSRALLVCDDAGDMGEQDWPEWATEAVRIVPYDHGWPARAAELGEEAASALGGLLSTDVHHVGSTAVPGLAAKPVIDLLAGVASLDVAAEAAKRLAPLDWHLVPPELDARPWRRLLVKVIADRRAAHLHLMRPDTERWRAQLAFRDRLRGDPAKAAEYERLKQRLAVERSHDREGYTAAKACFIRAVLRDGPTR